MAGQTLETSIDVDTRLYSAAAAMRAAYKFSGRCHVALEQGPAAESRLTVILRPKTSSVVDEHQLRGDFMNELLDQRLREVLEAEFGSLRELIVAQAFADTNLIDPAREEADYVADPLDIGAQSVGRDRSSR